MIETDDFRIFSDYAAYQNAVQNGSHIVREEERLTQEDEMEEFMFLGLRMAAGICRSDFRNTFGKTVEMVYGDVIQTLEKQELLKCEEDRIFLTARGVDISNYVFEQFLFIRIF